MILRKTVIYCGGEVVGLGEIIENIGFYLSWYDLGIDIFEGFLK